MDGFGAVPVLLTRGFALLTDNRAVNCSAAASAVLVFGFGSVCAGARCFLIWWIR